MAGSSDQQRDGESKQATVVAVAVVFASLSAVVVSLRLYTRQFILGVAGADDWTMLAATVLAVGAAVGTILEAHWGLGRHVWTLSPDVILEQLKALLAVILTYNLASNVVKISFLLQFRRIFSSVAVTRISLWLMVFVGIWAMVQVVLLSVACVPLATIVPSVADKCLSTLPIWYFSSAVNILSDFIIFVIPLPSVYRLKLPRQQKVVVWCIFCLGFFVCIISIVRIFTLRIAAVTEDPTWDNTEAACWSIVEVSCAILCGSLPTLRPLLGKLVPGLASTSRPTEYQMYGAGRDGNKPTVSASHSHGQTAIGSTEALKKPGTLEDDIAAGYRGAVGRSNCVTTVRGGPDANADGHSNADSDQDAEIAAASRTLSLKTPKDILVVTETMVREDNGRKGRG